METRFKIRRNDPGEGERDKRAKALWRVELSLELCSEVAIHLALGNRPLLEVLDSAREVLTLDPAPHDGRSFSLVLVSDVGQSKNVASPSRMSRSGTNPCPGKESGPTPRKEAPYYRRDRTDRV